MRRLFADELYKQMKDNPDIWVIVGDLGYKLWDEVRNDFPHRFINTGAAEVAMIDIAVGLALEGKIPFVYTATPFLLYRPFESIRNYLNHENIAVKLVGSGRDKDYLHDGWSHWAEEDGRVMALFPKIISYWPEEKKEIPTLVKEIVSNGRPCYINLRRK